MRRAAPQLFVRSFSLAAAQVSGSREAGNAHVSRHQVSRHQISRHQVSRHQISHQLVSRLVMQNAKFSILGLQKLASCGTSRVGSWGRTQDRFLRVSELGLECTKAATGNPNWKSQREVPKPNGTTPNRTREPQQQHMGTQRTTTTCSRSLGIPSRSIVTGPGSDQDRVLPAEHGSKISGPRSHLLTGGNLFPDIFLDLTTTSLSGPEILRPHSASGTWYWSYRGPVTPEKADVLSAAG